MAVPPAFVLLLLLLVLHAVEQGLCVDGTPQSRTTANTYARGGIRAKLIWRDHYFEDENDASTPAEKLQRASSRSLLRARYVQTKTQAAGTALTSPSPASGYAETTLIRRAADYLIEIYLGTPPLNFLMVGDTGSDLTWLTSCSKANQSSTYDTLGCSSTICRFLNESGSFCPFSEDAPSSACSYEVQYGDGTLENIGTLAQDTITLQTVAGGVQNVQNYSFGCATNPTGYSYKIDGVVGLGRGNISFPRQLGKYFGYKFGHCLVNRLFALELQSTPLFFGEDAVPSDTQLQYTPLLSSQLSSTFYYVGCTGIALHGATIDTIPASAFDIASDGTGGLIFDLGTTYAVLADHIYNPFVAALQAQISSNYTVVTDHSYIVDSSLCYNSSWSDWIADYGTGVPIITFQLTNTTGYTLAVSNAWFDALSYPHAVCLAIQSTPGRMSIFGSIQQVDFHILYDLENQHIGFVQANCSPVAKSSNSQAQKTGFSVGTTLFLSLLAMTIALTC